MRALVIGNAADLDLGFVGQRLREHGYVFTECHREHPGEWPGLDGVQLVFSLGSEWNVYNEATAPLVEAEAELMRRTLHADVPLLAICFGAQVLAHAVGGTVSRSERPEIGWYELDDIDNASAPVAAGPWMEWHDDVFTVPPGFDELARTAAGPQLVRGGRALGTQFHPEVTETMLARWLRGGGAEQYRRYGGQPDELLAETRANVERSRPNAESLVDWFVMDVASA